MKLTIISILLFATVAHADNNKEKAEALFKQGKKLMEQKRFADACAAFEKSNKLDPGIGAQLNTAKCYQEWGKIGRAYLAYQAAEKAAQEANDKRVPQIHEYVVALEPDVPHLTIKLPNEVKADGVKVTLDNEPLTSFNTPIVVDPGPHMIEWYVSGSGRKQNQVVAVERGGKQEFTLEVQKKPDGGGGGGGGGETKPVEDDQPTATTGRNQRIAGIAVGAGGVVAITISTIMTVSAKSKYSDALAMYCGGQTDGCDMTGLTLTHEARTTANQATVVFLLGAAMVGGGVALYLLAPKPAPAPGPAEEREARSRSRSKSRYIVPAISPDGIGVVFGGHL